MSNKPKHGRFESLKEAVRSSPHLSRPAFLNPRFHHPTNRGIPSISSSSTRSMGFARWSEDADWEADKNLDPVALEDKRRQQRERIAKLVISENGVTVVDHRGSVTHGAPPPHIQPLFQVAPLPNPYVDWQVEKARRRKPKLFSNEEASEEGGDLTPRRPPPPPDALPPRSGSNGGRSITPPPPPAKKRSPSPPPSHRSASQHNNPGNSRRGELEWSEASPSPPPSHRSLISPPPPLHARPTSPSPPNSPRGPLEDEDPDNANHNANNNNNNQANHRDSHSSGSNPGGMKSGNSKGSFGVAWINRRDAGQSSTSFGSPFFRARGPGIRRGTPKASRRGTPKTDRRGTPKAAHRGSPALRFRRRDGQRHSAEDLRPRATPLVVFVDPFCPPPNPQSALVA